MTILYCASFDVNGNSVEMENYIMVYGPKKLLAAASCLVDATLEHPYYKEILAHPSNTLSLKNIAGVSLSSKEYLTEEESAFLRESFTVIFRKTRIRPVVKIG